MLQKSPTHLLHRPTQHPLPLKVGSFHPIPNKVATTRKLFRATCSSIGFILNLYDPLPSQPERTVTLRECQGECQL